MNGTITRKNMLETFSAMLKPARMIMNISREELADLSGLDESLIENVETGRMILQKSHYLALASVFDNVKYQEEENIYRALVRILTPERDDESSGEHESFVLVRRWFETFNEELVIIPGLNDDVMFEAGEDFRFGKEDDEDYDSDAEYEDADDDEDIEVLPGEKLTDSELEDLAANSKIIADTSAIGNENFPALVTRLEPLLRQADSVIIVPHRAIDELQESIAAADSEDEKLNLSDALKYVERKANEGLIKIRSYDFECADDSADDVISDVFDKLGKEYDFMFITQDARVYLDLVSGRENVKAAHVDDKGDLILWSDELFMSDD